MTLWVVHVDDLDENAIDPPIPTPIMYRLNHAVSAASANPNAVATQLQDKDQ